MFAYLRVERKLVEFEVFDEGSSDASFLEDERTHFRVEHDRVPDRLARLPNHVVDVQLRVPVLGPVYLARLLQRMVSK